MTCEGTVYIVDGDSNVRASVQELVESMGLKTQCFASAEDFLKFYSEGGEGCLVSDLRILGMSGLDLLKKLNELNSALPVILISGYANTRVIVQAMQAGVVAFLEKTCSEQELWEAISFAWRSSRDLIRRQEARNCIQQKMAQLTEDEWLALQLIVEGNANKQVAQQLKIAVRTVEERRRRVMEKLGVDSLAELVRFVVESENKPDLACPVVESHSTL